MANGEKESALRDIFPNNRTISEHYPGKLRLKRSLPEPQT